MTTILAIDTATEACSVALSYQGQVFQYSEVIPREHAQRLLPMIEQVLQAANCQLSEVEAIAFGRGPGAFTGVRIAVGMVQGLAFALACPVLPVSNLAALAQRAYREQGATEVAAAIDARMNEVYWGCYQLQQGEMRLVGTEAVLAPEQVSLPAAFNSENLWAIGTGWQTFADSLAVQPTHLAQQHLPDALDILQLAQFAWQRGEQLAAEQAQPVYLRNNIATPKQAN